MSDRGPDEWLHAAPDDLAKIVVGSGSYKHAAPTELGGPCGTCGYKLPLLRSWWGSGGTVAINMPLLTELSGAARRP